MGMTPRRCEGRLLIQSRRRTKTTSDGDETQTSLSDQTWYFCVLSAEEQDMRWFESADQAPPLAVTQVSKLYALDQTTESEDRYTEDGAVRERMLYIEDEAAGVRTTMLHGKGHTLISFDSIDAVRVPNRHSRRARQVETRVWLGGG